MQECVVPAVADDAPDLDGYDAPFGLVAVEGRPPLIPVTGWGQGASGAGEPEVGEGVEGMVGGGAALGHGEGVAARVEGSARSPGLGGG